MMRAIDSGAETAIMRDRNGYQRYHFGPWTETVRDRNGHSPFIELFCEQLGCHSANEGLFLPISLVEFNY